MCNAFQAAAAPLGDSQDALERGGRAADNLDGGAGSSFTREKRDNANTNGGALDGQGGAADNLDGGSNNGFNSEQ